MAAEADGAADMAVAADADADVEVRAEAVVAVAAANAAVIAAEEAAIRTPVPHFRGIAVEPSRVWN